MRKTCPGCGHPMTKNQDSKETMRMLLTDKRHEYAAAIKFIEPYKMTLPFGNPLPFLREYKMEVITRDPTLKEPNWKIKTSRKIHAKIMIGKKGVIIGSHNFTRNATENNHECSILITHPTMMEDTEAYFERLWKQAKLR